MTARNLADGVPSDPYLPLTVLSRYSGLSVRRLRDYLHDPTRPLPHYRIGGKIVVRRSDFDMWASQFRVTIETTSIDALVTDLCKSFR
jgi:hypothetical protein